MTLLLRQVYNPNICILVFENKEKIILVQEFADGGELYDFISSKGRLTEKEARMLFRQIISAVHYLHEVWLNLWSLLAWVPLMCNV